MNDRKRLWIYVLGLGVIGAAIVVLQPGVQETPAPVDAPAAPPALTERPAPTPGPIDLETFITDKPDQKARRKQWFREMHRAPPDVDWKILERQAGLEQLARRNALGAGAPPPDHTPGTWVERGSDNQAGRIHVSRVGPDGALYAGSDRGGIWRGETDGTDWQPIGDNLYGGAQWLELLGTAEDVRVVAATNGGLIHFSDDDGATWSVPEGLPTLWSIRRLAKSSDGDETLFMVATGDDGTWLYRSTDAGDSFVGLVDLEDFSGDLFADRTGGDDVYLVMGNALHLSVDAGDTWTHVGDVGNGDRAELAVSEAGAFYVVVDGAFLFHSTDGETWTGRGRINDYWGAMAASVIDPDLFVYGGVEAWISRDAGDNFTRKNRWPDYYSVYGGDEATQLHADMMGIDAWPDGDGEIWSISTDGGLYWSHDSMANVQNLSLDGLRVSQYYDMHTSWADPDHVIAGAQDQGYQVTAWATQDADDPLEFYQLVSGDYGHITSGDHTHEVVYSPYPGFLLIQYGEDEPTTGGIDFPENESYVPWIPPVVADPYNNYAVFFPATKLYRASSDDDFEWHVYSEDFELGGDEYLSAMTFSPADPERAYMATSNGKVFYSSDHGVTWDRSENRGPDDNWYYGQAIAASWTNPDVVTLGGSGYGVPAVYRSEDGGVSFFPWGDGLPDTLVYGLIEAMDGSGCVFAGTSQSVFERCPDDAEWTDITDNTAPVTTYWALEALPHENTIRLGSYGRGIWDFQMETPDCYPVEDDDGDGVYCHQDCDDGDDEVYPGAAEIAGDGIDQDCDGEDLTQPEPTDDTDDPVDEQPPVITPEPMCGCGAVPGPLGVGALAGLLLFARRRRRA
jgi:photosystem II stability/assembly factor-like uncharacterized protein